MLNDGFHDVPSGKIAVVVTHLEMTAPQLRGAALPNGLEYAPLARDLDVYRDLFRRVGEEWLWFGRLTMQETELAEILVDDRVTFHTLLKNGQPEAILELDFRQEGECELAYFGLTPALIGTGAGGYLMDRAQEQAFAHDIKRLHVHTCTIDSPQALGFYMRSGFTPYRQQIEIAPDPRLAGHYPETTAPRVPIIR